MNVMPKKVTPKPSPSQSDIETALGIGVSRSSGSARARLLRWGGLAVAAVAAAAAIYWMLGGNGTKVRYVTEPAGRGDLTVMVTATGTVQPTNTVEVSSELSGTVRKVMVDFNSKVVVGQTLAELDTDKLQASVDSSQAKLAAAGARVKDAEATAVEKKLDYERKAALVERQVISAQDLQAAKAAYDRALAAVESARADVGAAAADVKVNETNLSKSCICSPINGIVLSRNVEPGQTVASSLQAPVLFTIAEDLTEMEVQVDVDEADVGKVKEGQGATFSVDAYPDEKFTAAIKQLYFGSEVVQGVVTYKAVLSAENKQLLLRPGMTATAEIVVEHVKDAVTVPNAALRFSPPVASPASSRSLLDSLMPRAPRMRAATRAPEGGSERTVWVLDRNGEPKAVPVQIGATDGRRTQILKGDISPDQNVIVDTAQVAK
ncbi:MAG: efflux RND transporter periplasmic adaptor subunit [Hyphomicrobiales bacterium]